MIKGVNRKIIEINSTDSMYFEKAVFYIRPQMSDVPYRYLAGEARSYLAETTGSVKNHRKKRTVTAILIIAALLTASGIIFRLQL